jgi:hypothetical protein
MVLNILFKHIKLLFNSFAHIKKATGFPFVKWFCFQYTILFFPHYSKNVSLFAAQSTKKPGLVTYPHLGDDHKNEKHLGSEAYGILPYITKDTEYIPVQKLCRQNPFGCNLISL